MHWLFQQTSAGATYLQVVILIAFLALFVAPAAYITIRDFYRLLKTMKERDMFED